MKDQRMVFAENMRRMMNEKGISQADISLKLDVSSGTVSEWCSGKKYPRVDKLEQLAGMFGVLLSDLMYEEGSRPGNQEILTEKERAMISLFRSVPEGQRGLVLSMIEAALKNQK